MSKHGVTPTTVETLSERFQVDIDVTVSSRMKNKVLRIFDMWYAVWKNRSKADVVLIDTYSDSAFFYAKTCGKLCRVLNVPYIAFLHGGNLPKRFNSSPESSKKYLEGAQDIVSPSGYLKHAVDTHFGLDANIIPNYIDIENYPFKKVEDFSSINILWVRSFHQTYRPVMAVDLLSILRTKGFDARLTMIGPDKDGSMEETRKRSAELGLDSYLTITGRLSKKDWIALAASHNVFLNTTSIDNTPVSVMEAMALGLPVITTKVGGIPHLFQDGKEGIMVPDATAERLADVVTSLSKSPQTVASLSVAARKKAEEWDWSVVRKRWMDLFFKYIKNK